MRYLYFCLLLKQAFVIMYYFRKSPTNVTAALTSQYVVLLLFEELKLIYSVAFCFSEKTRDGQVDN